MHGALSAMAERRVETPVTFRLVDNFTATEPHMSSSFRALSAEDHQYRLILTDLFKNRRVLLFRNNVHMAVYSPAHCLHCLQYQLKVISTGSALETTTFSSQSATVLVASLLLYVVFFGLNRVSSM